MTYLIAQAGGFCNPLTILSSPFWIPRLPVPDLPAAGHSTRRYCIERRKGVDLKILNHQGLRNVWLTPRPSIGDITPAF